MTATIGEKIESHLIHVLPFFHLTDQQQSVLGLYHLLTKESLALSINAPVPRFSTINHDGIPFEISISMGEEQAGNLRILTEIGVPGASLHNRINQTCARLNEILEYLGMKGAVSDVSLALRILLPPTPSDLAGWRGGIWVGAGFSSDRKTGIKLYFNAADGPVIDQWKKMGSLLKELGWIHALRALLRMSEVITDYATPLGIATDLTPDGIGKVKFYFRTFLYSPEFIESVLTSANLSGHIDHFNRFSNQIFRENPSFPASAVIISAEFTDNSADNIDIKTDFCTHCLFSNDKKAESVVSSILEDNGLDPSRYHATLNELSCNSLSSSDLNHHAFLGMGYSHRKGSRFNIYLKPAIWVYQNEKFSGSVAITDERLPDLSKPDKKNITRSSLNQSGTHSPRFHKIRKSIFSAAAFIVTAQSPNGQWLDFDLPPGPSDAWVTGYIGLSLTTLPQELRTIEVETAIQRAISWCGTAMNADYGWGYNSITGSDADSTANVISFLSSCGLTLHRECYRELLSFQKDDGGFATYKLDDSWDTWGNSHTDVTPVALNALLTENKKPGPVFTMGRNYLVNNHDSNGIWQSYWWDTSLYSTWVNLILFERMGWAYRKEDCRAFLGRLAIPSDPFELALYTGCLCQLSGEFHDSSPLIESAFQKLTEMQLNNGSWIAYPKLRLTNNHQQKPWTVENPGPLFDDQQRLFTTATALRVLSPFYSQLGIQERRAFKVP